MMRIIKFRAWDMEEEVMHEWHGEFFYDTSPVTSYSGDFNRIPEEIVLMQYIRNDTKGNETYEGDVIKYLDAHGCSSEEGTEYEEFENIGVIMWDEEECLYYVTDRETVDLETLFYNGFEVLGNIYQNPELLKSK
jgi:uncharacterized phage protein (TIGR01671 family)